MGSLTEAVSSEDLMVTLVPIAVYWMCSGVYLVLERKNDYRFHTKAEEDAKNIVSKITVFKGVVLQQIFQIIISLATLRLSREKNSNGRRPDQPSLHVIILQIFVAMVAMDSWQYFAHRIMHMNRFLYRCIHSHHHKLVATYAFGAFYGHPLEGLIVDTAGGAIAFLVSGMTPRTSVFFISLSTIKVIDAHSGLWLPRKNFLQAFFEHNTAFHGIHHQSFGSKYNFSNLFFVFWDKLLGTYMPYKIEKRQGGGFEARPLNKME